MDNIDDVFYGVFVWIFVKIIQISLITHLSNLHSMELSMKVQILRFLRHKPFCFGNAAESGWIPNELLNAGLVLCVDKMRQISA